MKKLFLSIILTLCATVLMASPVSVRDARTVATNFWMKNLPAGSGSSSVELRVVEGTDFSQFYIFDVNNGQGFVIVSADDCAYPVLGYSMRNPAGELGANIRFWLGQYEAEIAYLAAQNAQPDPYIEAQWKNLYNGTWEQPKGVHSVSPMLTTQWNQSPYYNSYCPTGTPAGCTAIAMAQVMKFWNHPAIGTGSHSYSLTNYGLQSADFGNTTYHWDQMPARLTSSSTQVQVQATATLCYHVGVSVNMSYAPGGSAAATLGSSNSAQSALPTYFGYKRSLRGIYKLNYSDADWCSTLTAELDAGRPILYAGFDPSAGHAFVFHGYNSNGQFYVNWGWGGSYDGYFSMGALNPGGGGTGTNGTNTFNQSNQALIGIEPAGSMRVSTDMINLTGEAGANANFVVSSNSHIAQGWTATASASWLTVSPSTGNGNGALTTVTATATQNTTGADRHATIQIVQDTDTVVVHVSQISCVAADMCALTINMTDTRSDGWEGAYLSFSSTSGTVYGTATVGGGNYSIESINVCPDTVVVEWHTGRTDSECGFAILNASGVAWANHVAGTAIADGQRFVIAHPCDTAGGVTPPSYSVTGLAGDTLAGSVTGSGTNLTFGSTRRLAALANSGYRFYRWQDGNTENPRNVTVTGNTTYYATYTNLGGDTLRYDDGEYSTAIGLTNNLNNFVWAVRFAASDLEARPFLEGVQFYNVKAGTYTVLISTGSAIKPSSTSQLYQGTITLSNQYTNRWITLSFDEHVALNVPSNKYLWVTLKVPGVSYPAALSRWSGNDGGSLYSSNGGTSWKNLSTDGNYGSWMLRAIAPIDNSEYTVTARPNRSAWGTVTGGGTYRCGTRVTLTATPNEGYHFVKWDNDVTNNPYTFTVTEDVFIRGVFAENTPEPPVGIEDAETGSTIALAVEGRSLTVLGAEGRMVRVFDALGRCVYSSASYDNSAVRLAAAGVYMVRVDGSASTRVVVY